MISIITAVAMIAGGVGALLAFRARNGQAHQIVKIPGMETTVALVIVCLLAGGAAALIAAALT